jgi:hypothetical protein
MNEAATVAFLRRRRHLRFRREVVDNPLFKLDFASSLHKGLLDELKCGKSHGDIAAIATKFHRRMRDKANVTSSRLLHVSVVVDFHRIPTLHNTETRIVQFRQILLLAHQMSVWFGRDATFLPDSFHPLTKFVVATSLVSKEFFKRFSIDRQYACAHQYADEIASIVARAGDGGAMRWDVTVCDANVFDAQSVSANVALDSRPTGPVYRADFGPQVELRGLDARGRAEYVIDGRPPKTTTSASSVAVSSIGAIAALVDKTPEDANILFATKRAGDWAQVEHCVRYNQVFVTSDVLAATYAYYRGADFMLLQLSRTLDYEHYHWTLGRKK